MTYPNDYTPQQRLAHEVRILLTLIELEEEAGPDLTGVFLYQREKLYELIKGGEPADSRATYKPDPALPGYAMKGAVHLSHDPNDYAPWEDAA